MIGSKKDLEMERPVRRLMQYLRRKTEQAGSKSRGIEKKVQISEVPCRSDG